MTPVLLLVALSGASAPIAPEAQMAPQCFQSLAEMAGYLDAWGETQAYSGPTDDGQGSLIVFTGPKTWSLVGSFGGLTCALDQGRDWKSHKTGAPL
jgi:hypothetical protein